MGKKKVPPPPPPPPEPKYELKKNISDFDMMVDLDNDFYYMANKCVRVLVDENKMEMASDVKTLVTVLEILHKRYKDEVEEKRELLPRIAEADEKLHLALKMTSESQEAMNSMKLALENAWKVSDASRTREQNLEAQLREMILKCKSMSNDVQSTEAEPEAEPELGKLNKYKHIILKERDRLQHENTELHRRLKMDRLYREQVDKQREDVEERVDKIQKLLDVVLSEKSNCDKKLKKAREEFDESKDVNRNLLLKVEEQEGKMQEYVEIIRKKSKDIEYLRAEYDHVKNEYAILNKNFLKISSQLNYTVKDKKTLQEQYKDLKADFKAKTTEAFQKGKRLKKCEDDYGNLTVVVSKMNKTIHGLKEEIVKLKNNNNNLDKTLLESTGRYDNLKRLKDSVTHERDSLRSDIMKYNNTISDLKLREKLRDNEIDNLKLNIQKLNLKLEDGKRTISQIVKEKEEQAQEIQGLNDKIDSLKEQLQLKIDQAYELNEKLNQKQAAYIKIQKLLETTNSERLMLQKSLQSCCEERSNLKGLLAKANYQITQLTEEITSNQNKINGLNLQIERLRSEKQDVETELRSTKSMLHSTRVELKEMKQKNEGLTKTIAEDEMKFMKLSIQLEDVRKEKNLIGLQMVRRNDEIMLLKERVQICQGALDKGEVQYNQRIEDIRLLKLEISDLQTQRNVLTKSLGSTANMREEIIRLQRALAQERVRNCVLSEDLNTPANVHRWRLLSGVDPDRFQLIEKCQMLQKTILKQQVEGMKKDTLLQEAHKIYLSMKSYMEKLPSYEVKTDLVQTQRVLRRKEKQMKALAAELTILHMDIKGRDCAIENLHTSLHATKKKCIKNISKCEAAKRDPSLRALISTYDNIEPSESEHDKFFLMEISDNVDNNTRPPIP